jgi:hypothetical protein
MLSIHLDQADVIAFNNIFDDYGGNYIYVFGSCFGAVITLFISYKSKTKVKNLITSETSYYYPLIGTGFIFATFPFTGIIYPNFEVQDSK